MFHIFSPYPPASVKSRVGLDEKTIKNKDPTGGWSMLSGRGCNLQHQKNITRNSIQQKRRHHKWKPTNVSTRGSRCVFTDSTPYMCKGWNEGTAVKDQRNWCDYTTDLCFEKDKADCSGDSRIWRTMEAGERIQTPQDLCQLQHFKYTPVPSLPQLYTWRTVMTTSADKLRYWLLDTFTIPRSLGIGRARF